MSVNSEHLLFIEHLMSLYNFLPIHPKIFCMGGKKKNWSISNFISEESVLKMEMAEQ